MLDDVRIKKMIDDFNQIKYKKRETNFFDVCGFPRNENVSSNILSFFFNPNEEHNFRDRWIKALLKAYGGNKVADYYHNTFNVEKIYREYSDYSKKRLDILIDCNDLIIVIENKIDANLYNDLIAYEKMTNEFLRNRNGEKKVIYILLSLWPIGDKFSFKNITYEDLFNCLEGDNLNNQDINNKWISFESEFIDNIKKLKGDVVMKLDNKSIEFYREYYEDINKINKLYKTCIDNILDFFKKIQDHFENENNQEQENYGNKKFQYSEIGVYNRSWSSHLSLFIDYKINDDIFVFELSFDKQNKFGLLTFNLWNRNNKNQVYDKLLKEYELPVSNLNSNRDWGNYVLLKEYETLNKELDINEIIDDMKKDINNFERINMLRNNF